MKRAVSGGRGTRPGLRACDAGSVTIEVAGAMLALTLFFTMLVSGLALFGAEFTLTSLARDAARAASMQSDASTADQAVGRVLRNAEGVRYAMSSRDGFVAVTLSKQLHLFRIPGVFSLRARASALEEVPWT